MAVEENNVKNPRKNRKKSIQCQQKNPFIFHKMPDKLLTQKAIKGIIIG
ncbi:MAG: hypothetical protein IKU51_06410 [Clostridia bacterium]|nr:hypothetical protein [Clostridia bacterium]